MDSTDSTPSDVNHEWRAPLLDIQFADFEHLTPCSKYNGKNIPQDEMCATLDPGMGYWLKFPYRADFFDGVGREYRFGRVRNLMGPKNEVAEW